MTTNEYTEKWKQQLDAATPVELLAKSMPQIAHAHECPFWRMGKSFGPCICGAEAANKRLEDFLGILSPDYHRCCCGHLRHNHNKNSGVSLDCRITGCKCNNWKIGVTM